MRATFRRPVVDRGERPRLRGHLYSEAAWFFAGVGTAQICVAAILTGASALTAATAVYVACLIGMLGVSATYHRFPWRSERAIGAWRRADHSMIAIFIAGTYGPVCIGARDGNPWLLVACWITALVAVAVNLFWIDHPRWVSVPLYLILGWLAIFDFDALKTGLSTPVLVLIVVGGIIYSLGAIGYGFRQPNLNKRWFGFHEVFHAATIVAAGLHNIAIWLIIIQY